TGRVRAAAMRLERRSRPSTACSRKDSPRRTSWTLAPSFNPRPDLDLYYRPTLSPFARPPRVCGSDHVTGPGGNVRLRGRQLAVHDVRVRQTPDAWTRIRSWSVPGSGTGIVVGTRESGGSEAHRKHESASDLPAEPVVLCRLERDLDRVRRLPAPQPTVT